MEGSFNPVRFLTGTVGNLNSSLQPGSGGGQIILLTGVAGEVVRNDGFLGEPFRGGQERIPGELKAAALDAAEGIGPVDPTRGPVRCDFDQGLAGLQARVPIGLSGAQNPIELEHIGMMAVFVMDAFKFEDRLPEIIEQQPTQGCIEAERVRWRQ